MNNHSMRFKLGLLACLYFSQGLPFGFLSQAMPAMLRDAGVDLGKIGMLSLVAFPWGIKFLWAPYVDRFGHRGFGKRKSWIVPLQGLFAVSLLLISLIDPSTLKGDGFYHLMLLMFLANLVAATQDVATDGLAVSSLPPTERGLANGVQVGGYRLGMLYGGGFVLILLDYFGWASTFYLMALTIVLVTVPVLFFREYAEGDEVLTHEHSSNVLTLAKEFIAQPGMLGWLLVLVCYKIGDAFVVAMTKPLLVDLGLTLGEIGWISGGFGLAAGVFGALLGGWLVPVWGRVRSLVIFGVLQASVALGFGYLAHFGGSTLAIALVTIVEHFFGGMATAALFTLMMDACRRPLAGTDYTIQASLHVAIVGLLQAASGFSAQALGYTTHFVMSFVIGVVALLSISVWLRQVPAVQRESWHQL